MYLHFKILFVFFIFTYHLTEGQNSSEEEYDIQLEESRDDSEEWSNNYSESSDNIIDDIEIRKTKQDLLLLFYRCMEFIGLPKGPNNTVFKIPDKYWVDRYDCLRADLSNLKYLQRHYGDIGEQVLVEELEDEKLSKLSKALSVGPYSTFIHVLVNGEKYTKPILKAFMEAETMKEMLSWAAYVRDRMNPYFFTLNLAIALLHRPDTRDVCYPCMVTVLPQLFIDSETLSKAREHRFIAPDNFVTRIKIPNEVTAPDTSAEHQLAYFREDMGMNVNHMTWHMIYYGDNIKDRDGEIFYFFHNQIMNRYGFERLSNNLPRVVPFSNLREPIKEGYFPKLHSCARNRVVPGRSQNTPLKDVNRPKDEFMVEIEDVEEWQKNIHDAIINGSVVTDKGELVKLDEWKGTDILGSMIAPNKNSLNKDFYGSMHGVVHGVISVAHDPDGSNLEQCGVMADQTTAMRDPIFYRWHGYLNNLFMEHKQQLPSYTENQLVFKGVQITQIKVVTHKSNVKNRLITMWRESDLDISRGMDFTGKGSIIVTSKHLWHAPFSYIIQVENAGKRRKGTCRIFLAPTEDENAVPFSFNEQKDRFIEMDKFIVDLEHGPNTINRSSEVSTTTIPFEGTFQEPSVDRKETNTYCGCGWPHHLLVPKGTVEGLPCNLFVMISDYEEDKVSDTSSGEGYDVYERGVSFCGQRGKYPDRRAMGYPFDRPLGVSTVDKFLTPNMFVTDVSIRHYDKIINESKDNKEVC